MSAASQPPPTVRYVPNEIIIVVQIPANVTDEAAKAAIYAKVQEDVNAALMELEQPTDRPGRLGPDLQVESAWFDQIRGGELLCSLRSEGGRLEHSQVTPWIAVPSEVPRCLCVYQVGDEKGVVGDDQKTSTWLPRTKQLVNLINWHLKIGGTARLLKVTHPIVAVTPNWVTAGGGGSPSEGSPGGRPRAVLPDFSSCHFDFVEPELDDTVTQAQESTAELTVAILDTCPRPDTFPGATATPAKFPANLLYQDLTTRLEIDDVMTGLNTAVAGVSQLPYLDHYTVRWPDPTPPGAHPETTPAVYDMADHGLFIAGIIHSIVPKAKLKLYRVLGDFGVGDLGVLAFALTKVYKEQFVDKQNQRLIINMSLGIDHPTGMQLLHEWIGEHSEAYKQLLPAARSTGAKDLEAALETLQASNDLAADVLKILNALRQSLSVIVEDWLTKDSAITKRVLIVAAAGNDHDLYDHDLYLGGTLRPEPRWPARYDQVFSVTAVKRQPEAVGDTSPLPTPSSFSNRGDTGAPLNGIATFGGDAVDGVTTDGIIGLFSADTLPRHLPHVNNETGWVEWAGSSFATPIISAVAAAKWLTDPSETSQGVLKWVWESSFPPGQQANPNIELTAPILQVRQVLIP